MTTAKKPRVANPWSAKAPPPKDVDAFIRASPRESQSKLREMRAVVRAVAPEAEEFISYRMPTYKLNGQPFVAFAGFKKHIGFYPMSGSFLDGYKEELKDYARSRGAVQFPLSEPLPVGLIKRMIRDRLKPLT